MAPAMGTLRFHLSSHTDLPADIADRTTMVSLEGVPWSCRVECGEGELRLVRQVHDSGYVHVPFRTTHYGELILSTATVLERAAPYRLIIELARGTLHRVATQLGEWQLSGLQDTQPIEALLARAKSLLAQAVTGDYHSADADKLAGESLDVALDASEGLMALYTAQVIAMRRQEASRIPTWLICNLGAKAPAHDLADAFTGVFSAAAVPLTLRAVEPSIGDPDWGEADRQVDWCGQHGLRICAGPLFSLDPLELPDWIYLWEYDFETIAGYIRQHMQRVLQRYQGRVHLWHGVAKMNSGQGLPWGDEERLQMTAIAMELIRQHDKQTPVIISVDQPWGEYMVRSETDLAPLYYADALLRANLGVTGIGIELNFGYATQGMSARDRLAISRKLDHWSMLGVPLAVFVTVPSSSQPDANSRDPRLRVIDGEIDLRWQQQAAEALYSMLLSKRYVQIVVWNQWSDSGPHRLPHGGLVDHLDQPKPSLDMLQSMRRDMMPS